VLRLRELNSYIVLTILKNCVEIIFVLTTFKFSPRILTLFTETKLKLYVCMYLSFGAINIRRFWQRTVTFVVHNALLKIFLWALPIHILQISQFYTLPWWDSSGHSLVRWRWLLHKNLFKVFIQIMPFCPSHCAPKASQKRWLPAWNKVIFYSGKFLEEKSGGNPNFRVLANSFALEHYPKQ
jgi:hypothetical protein